MKRVAASVDYAQVGRYFKAQRILLPSNEAYGNR